MPSIVKAEAFARPPPGGASRSETLASKRASASNCAKATKLVVGDKVGKQRLDGILAAKSSLGIGAAYNLALSTVQEASNETLWLKEELQSEQEFQRKCSQEHKEVTEELKDAHTQALSLLEHEHEIAEKAAEAAALLEEQIQEDRKIGAAKAEVVDRLRSEMSSLEGEVHAAIAEDTELRSELRTESAMQARKECENAYLTSKLRGQQDASDRLADLELHVSKDKQVRQQEIDHLKALRANLVREQATCMQHVLEMEEQCSSEPKAEVVQASVQTDSVGSKEVVGVQTDKLPDQTEALEVRVEELEKTSSQLQGKLQPLRDALRRERGARTAQAVQIKHSAAAFRKNLNEAREAHESVAWRHHVEETEVLLLKERFRTEEQACRAHKAAADEVHILRTSDILANEESETTANAAMTSEALVLKQELDSERNSAAQTSEELMAAQIANETRLGTLAVLVNSQAEEIKSLQRAIESEWSECDAKQSTIVAEGCEVARLEVLEHTLHDELRNLEHHLREKSEEADNRVAAVQEENCRMLQATAEERTEAHTTSIKRIGELETLLRFHSDEIESYRDHINKEQVERAAAEVTAFAESKQFAEAEARELALYQELRDVRLGHETAESKVMTLAISLEEECSEHKHSTSTATVSRRESNILTVETLSAELEAKQMTHAVHAERVVALASIYRQEREASEEMRSNGVPTYEVARLEVAAQTNSAKLKGEMQILDLAARAELASFRSENVSNTFEEALSNNDSVTVSRLEALQISLHDEVEANVEGAIESKQEIRAFKDEYRSAKAECEALRADVAHVKAEALSCELKKVRSLMRDMKLHNHGKRDMKAELAEARHAALAAAKQKEDAERRLQDERVILRSIGAWQKGDASFGDDD
eukprot:TRINITY_DN27486_c0_g2_i1.p1 TRINITY_DN27486_c0_g2~~TRINITY_DN27486_c0_g2_i1.p1  ORF type:complete len:889 (+),score=207.90 TRINITY_DN27486_c0_g2_i1:201-2867(+)